jgi:hypothetical protein
MENQIEETLMDEIEEEKHPTWNDVQDPYLRAYNRIIYSTNLLSDGYSEDVVIEYLRAVPEKDLLLAQTMTAVLASLDETQRETMVNKITSGAIYLENMPVEEGLFH